MLTLGCLLTTATNEKGEIVLVPRHPSKDAQERMRAARQKEECYDDSRREWEGSEETKNPILPESLRFYLQCYDNF